MSALAPAPRHAPRRAAPPGRPDLRIVAPPRHTVRYVAALLIVAVLGVVGVVSLSALAAEAAFEARSLQSEVTELTLRYDELTAEVAALEAPERIRAVAEGELGMIPAEEPVFLVAQRHLEDAPGSADPLLESGELADRIKPVLSR